MKEFRFITEEEWMDLRNGLDEIKQLLKEKENRYPKYLRSKQLQSILGISSSSLQNLRIKSAIPFVKLEGIIFYPWDKIQKLLENKMKNFNEK